MATFVAMPPQLVVREQSWQQTDPRSIQEAEFTSAERQIVTGPIAKWRCQAEIVARTADELLAVRQWLARMNMPGAYTIGRPYPEGGQQAALPGASASAVVDGGGQAGYALALRGLAPSTTHLRGGHLIEFATNGGANAAAVLREDLVADATGKAVAQLATPIPRSPADGEGVFLRFPHIWLWLPNPMQWMDKLYQLHELPTLQLRQFI